MGYAYTPGYGVDTNASQPTGNENGSYTPTGHGTPSGKGSNPTLKSTGSSTVNSNKTVQADVGNAKITANANATESGNQSEAVSAGNVQTGANEVGTSDASFGEAGWTKGNDFSWVTNVAVKDKDSKWDTLAKNASDQKALNTATEVKSRNWYDNSQLADLNRAGELTGVASGKGGITGTTLNYSMEDLQNASKKVQDNIAETFSNNNNKTVADLGKSIRDVDLPNNKGNEFQIGEKNGYDRDMYEYALGMTSETYGENYSIETLPVQIEEASDDVSRIERQLATLKSRGEDEAVISKIEQNLENAKSRLENLEQTRDLLQQYVDTFADMYDSEEVREPDRTATKEAKALLDQAMQERFKAWGAYYQATGETFDALQTWGNVKSDVHNAAKVTIKGMENFDEPTAVFNQDRFYATFYDHNETFAVSEMKDGKWRIDVPAGKQDGIERGQLFDTREEAIAARNQYFFSMTRRFIERSNNETVKANATRDLASLQALAAEAGVSIANSNYLQAMDNDAKSIHENVQQSQQDIMDRYANGEITAVQAANQLSKLKDAVYDFDYNNITSEITDNYREALGETDKIPGMISDTTVGKDTLLEDIAPSADKSEQNISEKIVATAKQYLTDYNDKIANVDINSENAEAELSQISNDLATDAKAQFESIVKDLVATGADLQAIRDNPDIKAFSSDLFVLAQNLYDKTSELEALGKESLGIDSFTKKNFESAAAKVKAINNEAATYSVYKNKLTLTREESKALMDWSKSIDATKSAAIALMKSAAFNGAENAQGAEYSESWKDSKAYQMTWKDWAGATFKGLAGTVSIVLGAAMSAVNPALGGVLLTAGILSATKTGSEMALKGTRANSTNAEAMFTDSEYNGKNLLNDIYNRSLEEANYGDTKSVGTYVNAAEGLLDFAVGMSMLTNPLTLVSGLDLINDARIKVIAVTQGGLQKATDNAILNVYNLAENTIEAFGLDAELLNGMSDPSERSKYIEQAAIRTTGASATPTAATGNVDASYGVATDDSSADNTYNGYRENAVNSNVAKDYNYGMEKEVNEAVSDKDVKGYIVRIYSKEPDWFRKAVAKVLAMHSEREWL